MSLHILQAGMMSTVQDWGRYGYQAYGISPGGPMDEHAFLWANHLLENDFNDAQIEITYGMFTCCFNEDTYFAICGAEVDARLNNKAIQVWHSYEVRAGDILQLGAVKSGQRNYLAINGGFQAHRYLNSRSQVLREGSALIEKDQHIAYEPMSASELELRYQRVVADKFIPRYNSAITLQCLQSYQWQEFSPDAQEQFLSASYVMTQDQNRMGFRIRGPALNYLGPELLSEGIIYGAIQVPADGQPIILAKEHQSIGGYPKIACVARLSMSALAQAKPGTVIRFELIDLEQASQQLLARNKYFAVT